MQNVFIKRSHDRNVQLRKTNEIQAHQIERARFFYIQILIIAFRENHHFNSCVRCVRKRNLFAKCYDLNALKKKTCVNCVWRNDSTQCQHRTKFQSFLICRKLMISNAMYAILRFASFFFSATICDDDNSSSIDCVRVKISYDWIVDWNVISRRFQHSAAAKANDDAVWFYSRVNKNHEVCFYRTKR